MRSIISKHSGAILAAGIIGMQLLACDNAVSPAGVAPGPQARQDTLSGTLAFVSTREGAPHIYLASPKGAGVRRLTNQLPTEFSPAWSPDGSRLAFNSTDGTYIIKRDGSGLRRLREGGSSPSWSPDGKRILVTDSIDFRMIPVDDESAGVVHIAIDPHSVARFGLTRVFEGAWSPNGELIAFGAYTGDDFERVFILNLATGDAEIVVRGGEIWDECGPRWSPDGGRLSVLSMVFRAAATVDAGGGQLKARFSPGTSCWDQVESGEQSESGIGWSPDGYSLAVTMRTPSWTPAMASPGIQRASIAIVDIGTQIQLELIPDAYDPSWAR